MSWTDALKGVLDRAEQGSLPDILKSVLGTDGLRDLLGKLQGAGLADEVQSWFNKNKDNLPISPDQIRTALGEEHVQKIARSLGIPVDAILAALAEKLPEIANEAGPEANPSDAPPDVRTIPDPKSP
jgi:uncharacterized protein YidB (DUF937 family)